VASAVVLVVGSAVVTRLAAPAALSLDLFDGSSVRAPADTTVVGTGIGATAGSTTAPSASGTASATTPTSVPTSVPVRQTRAAATARAQAAFSSTVSAYLDTRSGNVGVMAVDVGTGVVISSGAHTASFTASIVKLDILAALLLQRQDAGRLPTASEQALARRMITESDNAAASALWQRIGGASGLVKVNRRLGLRETVPGSRSLWGLTSTTAADQLRLLTVVTGYGGVLAEVGVAGNVGVLGAAQRSYAVRLMEQVDDEQAWGVSAAAGDDDTALKNGWLPHSGDGYRWLVNSIGRVRTANGSTVLVAVLSRRSPSFSHGVTTVEKVSRLAASALRTA
jgi:beta-lactamase class A